MKIRNKPLRSFVAKLRTGCLRLRKEIGRYRRERREERICEQCKLEQVEDEEHFLIKCPFYCDLRRLDICDWTWETVLKLLECSDNVFLQEIFKFWKLRNTNRYHSC